MNKILMGFIIILLVGCNTVINDNENEYINNVTDHSLLDGLNRNWSYVVLINDSYLNWSYEYIFTNETTDEIMRNTMYENCSYDGCNYVCCDGIYCTQTLAQCYENEESIINVSNITNNISHDLNICMYNETGDWSVNISGNCNIDGDI